MKFWKRVKRHLKITSRAYQRAPSPTFLTLFINSICNQKCEHCFYWQNLNKKDDLTRDELFALSDDLGEVENLYLSGGEPFLRPEFGEICRKFIQTNRVKQIYVPTNASFADKAVTQIRETLKEKSLDLFVAEFSLDGMPAFHDEFRGMRNAFARAMETYDALVELQKEDSRLKIHAISTATDQNIDEIRRLTTYLFERCPKMDHHNLGIIRGDRKNPSLQGPSLVAYRELFTYVQRLWADRERHRYGSIVEPMLQWAKGRTSETETQFIPCTAGRLSGVVHANGDVAVCETHGPLGNLRTKSFSEIWNSEEAHALRKSIRAKECYCTAEISLWPSIVYQPTALARGLAHVKPWQKIAPLKEHEKDTSWKAEALESDRGETAPQAAAEEADRLPKLVVLNQPAGSAGGDGPIADQ